MFKVGDTVVITNSGREYSITKDGSIGIITQVNPTTCKVKFTQISYSNGTLREAYSNEKFTIDHDYLKHTTSYVEPTQIEKVCAKIKQMEERRKAPPTIPTKVYYTQEFEAVPF